MTRVCSRSAGVFSAVSRGSEDPAAVGAVVVEEVGDFWRSSVTVHLHTAAGRECVVWTGSSAAQSSAGTRQHTFQVKHR